MRQESLAIKRRIVDFGKLYAPDLDLLNIFTFTAEIDAATVRPLPYLQPQKAIEAMAEIKGNFIRAGAFDKDGAVAAWQSIQDAWLELLPKKRSNGTPWIINLESVEKAGGRLR